jgi:hypothetical protein
MLWILVSTSVLAGGWISGGGPALAAEATPTQLALSGPSAAAIGTTVTLTAALESTSGGSTSPLPGETVALQRLDDGTWTSVATGTTGQDGQVSLSTQVRPRTTAYRASFDGDESYAASTSPVIELTGTRMASTLRIGGKATMVYGRAAHLWVRWRTADGRPVDASVRLESRRGGGRWHQRRRITLGHDGYAKVTVRPSYSNSYRVAGRAGPGWRAATAGAHRVRVLPAAAPVVLPSGAPRPERLPAQPRASATGAHPQVSRIPNRVWSQMTGITWHAGCPVGRAGLRLLRVNYWGFDGFPHRGELVINAHATRKFVGAFTALYRGRFPIRAMYRVDRFGWSKRSHGGNDFAAMRHDDTSAFNCRWVTGSPGVRSPHSSGYAVDLNTWENPYRSRIGLLPNSWWMGHSNSRYAWRSRSAPVVRVMRAHGFRWTYGLADTQHFDA